MVQDTEPSSSPPRRAPDARKRRNEVQVLECADQATTLSARSTGQLARFVATAGRYRGMKTRGQGIYDMLLQDIAAMRDLVLEMQRLDAEDEADASSTD